VIRRHRQTEPACGGLTEGAIRRRARLNAVARHYRVLVANYCQVTTAGVKRTHGGYAENDQMAPDRAGGAVIVRQR